MTALEAIFDRFDPDDFRHRGACAGQPFEIFFPARGASLEPARKFCDACPVAEECLEYALEGAEKFGIWGGLSERTGRAIRRDRRARARP